MISGGQFGNHCRKTLWNSPTAAAILDFRPKLGNHCKFSPAFTLFRASILDFKARLVNRCSTIVVAVENGPPAAAVAATISAADSNFRCCDGRLRPILIFVAAKKNGPPAASVATTIFRVRFHSSLPRKKMVPPADRSLTCPDLGLQSESR